MTMPFRLSAVAGLMLLGAMANAGAETTTDRYGKELKIEPSRNIFARFGVLGLKMNNKSEAAKDVSGPVLSAPANSATGAAVDGERGWYCPDDGSLTFPTCTRADAESIYSGSGAIRDILFGTSNPADPRYTGLDSLGLPDNVKARFADPAPGVVGTLGMYFDEDKHWAIEVPVMALPFSVDVYGAGTFQNAGKIVTSKALGFLVFGHYYFGQKNDKFRPSVSLTANYLLPFDTKATPSLERWTGGRTTVSSKGSLGLGWLVGGKYAIDDRWDLNFSVGQFKGKVESTLTTYDTSFTARTARLASPIFTYWPGQLGENLRYLISQSLLEGQLKGMEAYRNNADAANRVNGGANLGNYTRTQKQTLDPYVLMMTVGYNF
ncbi:OmpW family outer membrane protein [Aquabacterium sp.]|uniref:OmpW/AlkL family protein n=1 Tax=Aquabacterium sp. TaxID=1872578 RepID=UPI002486FCD3|nr:OmpW family outer membrane protein [Aquabacterium sp.]MDI1259824.1 hypothetical protein [Aquabacterium sp.]